MALFSNTNPADKAMPHYKQAEDAINQGYTPYGGIGTDPTKYYEDLISHYTPSKSYQLHLDQALKQAGNAAAAGGMRGSPTDLMNTTHITDTLLGEDMQQWLKNIYNIRDFGYKADTQKADNLSNIYSTEGSLDFQGQRQSNQDSSDFWSALAKILGGGAGAAFGPAGAAVGSYVGDKTANWLSS